MSGDDLQLALQAARQRHKDGEGSVLDCLFRALGDSLELRTMIHRDGGVGILTEAEAGEITPSYERIGREQATAWRCVEIVDRRGARSVAAEDPWNTGLLRKVQALVGLDVRMQATTGTLLQALLADAQDGNAQLSPPFVGGREDGPVVRLVQDAIATGRQRGASDIHFECDRAGVSVKHRIDGVMRPYARLSGQPSAEEVISRIKVLAQLDITERRLPQDGRFRFVDAQGGAMDLRVSIMPSVTGEDAVLRLLDKGPFRANGSDVSLDALGFEDAAAGALRSLCNLPSGMLLVTGPTGSGKTTTVYAVLAETNSGAEKIITIEDPVEYELPGVLQIPVNERKGLTFARGLRSILRHDPDRILVGEIRDAETAEIAVQSALTGHQVFTTVHANSVSDVVGRFRHFGIDMFGFMSSLNGIVVQRLLRRLCRHCRVSRPATQWERTWLVQSGRPEHEQVFASSGCGSCSQTGYSGRFVIAEVHRITDTFRDHVTQGAPLSVLKQWAYAEGVQSLQQQALERAASGETSLEEVRRVVGAY